MGGAVEDLWCSGSSSSNGCSLAYTNTTSIKSYPFYPRYRYATAGPIGYICGYASCGFVSTAFGGGDSGFTGTLISHCSTVCTLINHCYTVCTLIHPCCTVCTLINHCYTVCTLIHPCCTVCPLINHCCTVCTLINHCCTVCTLINH
jgi:hypothetical protein